MKFISIPCGAISISLGDKTYCNTIVKETSFFNGGVAREVAFHYLKHNEMPTRVQARDLDILVGGTTPQLDDRGLYVHWSTK